MSESFARPRDEEHQQLVVSAADASSDGALTVRTVNSNMGAVRVQVTRDLARVRHDIGQLAAYFGEQFEYAIPFKKRSKTADGRWIEKKEFVRGPSVRCTTAVARSYGNCSVDCTEGAESSPRHFAFDATFLDVQSGFRLTRPFRQRKTANIGGMGGDADRVEDILFQVGASKATRNVIRNALPDLCEYALEEARNGLLQRIAKQPEAVRTKIDTRLKELRIPLQRVEAFYGVQLAKMQPPVMAQIVGLLQAVADGMLSPADVCPQGDSVPQAGVPMPERAEGDEPGDDAVEPPPPPPAPAPRKRPVQPPPAPPPLDDLQDDLYSE